MIKCTPAKKKPKTPITRERYNKLRSEQTAILREYFKGHPVVPEPKLLTGVIDQIEGNTSTGILPLGSDPRVNLPELRTQLKKSKRYYAIRRSLIGREVE